MSLTDTDILTIALEFREAMASPIDGVTARCAMICWPLAGYLDFLGLAVETKDTTVGHWNHVWLLLPDGRVLDPTADQFDATLPPVYLGAKLAMHRREHHGRPRRRRAHPGGRDA